MHRVGGKQKLLALGVYPEVSLKEAREKQANARKQLRNGQDPAEVKRAHKRQARTHSENSVENIVREWHNNRGRWNEDRAHRVFSSLQKEVFPHVGANSIQEITAPAIVGVIKRIEKRDALHVVSRALQRVSSVYCMRFKPGARITTRLLT